MTTAQMHRTSDRLFYGRALVVANPAAAGVNASVLDEVCARLAPCCEVVQQRRTTAPGSATALVSEACRDARPDVVVAVGGDGTVQEVAEALSRLPGRPPDLLALPAGSGNSTCRNLWGGLDLPQVLDLALDPSAHRVRRVDLLHLVEARRSVVLGASTGFLAEVLIGARDLDATIAGFDRYLVAAAQVLEAMPAHPTRVTVDGVVLSDGPTSSVAVGGGRFRARDFQFLPLSLLGDGLLDVSTIGALDSAQTAVLAPLVPGGEHLLLPQVEYTRGRRIEIERTDGQPLVAEFDGEIWATAGPTMTVEVRPAALRVLAPITPPCG